MSQPMDVQRKMRQLDNDVQSIYELLATITGTQTRHGNRLEEMGVKLDAVDRKVDGLDGRLDTVEARLDTVDGKLDGVDGRLETVDGKLDTVIQLLGGRNAG